MITRITLLATRQEPASLEEPSAIKISGPTTAGPALQAGWVGLAPSEGQSNSRTLKNPSSLSFRGVRHSYWRTTRNLPLFAERDSSPSLRSGSE
jgi:hypothetical protein